MVSVLTSKLAYNISLYIVPRKDGEYQPKGGDALRLGSKGRYGS